MRVKDTCLVVFLAGMAWTVYLFAYQAGPDPDNNGRTPGQTCALSGCHTGNPLNAAPGSVAINGLPANYTPGQAYDLQVVITRSGASRFGFQLSAVDGQNRQAGVLASTNNRTTVVTAGGIQYVQHTLIATTVNPNGTFSFRWTAPAAAVGPIRFNAAGNAANGNSSNSGDFIYTATATVQPGVTTDNTVRAFQFPNLGGTSATTDGGGAAVEVGYARILPAAGQTTPSGVAIFGYRPAGVLLTETGVPASALVTSGRIYAEVNGPVNTGVAVANPGTAAATVNFSFTNASGADFGAGVLNLAPGEQNAAFLNQAPFNGGSNVQGTFSFTSTAPISMVALRGLTNERNEFLLTTLPVVDPTTPGTGAFTLPYYADGGGWTTQILLVNPTDTTITGAVAFPSAVTIGGQSNTTFQYSVPRRSSVRLATAGAGAAVVTGSVRVTPATGAAPSALVVFAFRNAGITVTEAGVGTLQGSAFRMYVQGTGSIGQVGAIQTGVAITNTSASAATINFELFRLDGSSTGLTAPLNNVAAGANHALFLNELFPTLQLPFEGVLRISTTGSGIAIVGLRGRTNERGDFLITTTPPTSEATPASAAEMVFPHLVNGGGYTTQFVIFSGSAGQAGSGNLRFFKQDGTGLTLTLP